MDLMRVLIKGSRPKTLIASISPVLIGTTFAFKLHNFSLLIFLSTLVTALLIQILTNFANDYFDYKKGADTPTRVGPQRIMQGGLLKETAMIKILAVLTSTTIISATPIIQVGGILVVELLTLALVLAYLYTATPLALAYKGMADLVVFFCFGPLAFYMTQALQTKFYLCPSFFGMGAGAMSAALLALNNLRDFEEDKKTGKKTLIVRFGINFGKKQILFYSLLLFLPLFILTKNHLFYTIPTLFILWPMIKFMKCKTSEAFASYFPKLTLFFWLYTLTFCICLLYI